MSERDKPKTTPNALSKNEKTASHGAQDEHQNGSVYDFLYHDPRRIGSFLAQFDDSGVLTGVTQGDTAARGARRGWRASLGGSMDGAGIGPGGNVSFESIPAEAGSSSSSRVYDPLWTNALTFLDYVEEEGLLSREPDNAGMGQLVLISGGLWIVDTTILRTMMTSPYFKKMITGSAKPTGNRHDRRAAASAPTNQNQSPDSIEGGIALMELMPHLIQARVTSGTTTYWASLLPEGLTTSPSDLFLKHGLRPAGEWAMVGVLDAVPDSVSANPLVENIQALAELGQYMGALYPIASATRPMIGRPARAYGVTPLLIFREVFRGAR